MISYEEASGLLAYLVETYGRETAFGNWTLTLAESVTWLQLARTQGTAGENTVTVNILESNETAADRSAVVTLTSRGVSEPITITQKKRPETE